MTSLTQSPIDVVRRPDALHLIFPDDLEVVFALEDGDLLGIGAVSVNGLPLRQSTHPWRPVIHTPSGIHYHRFRLLDVEAHEQGVDVVCEAIGWPTRIADEQDEYLCELVDLGLTQEARGRLTWRLAPCTETIQGHRFAGFALQYRFESEEPLHRLIDFATWEIGGTTPGNTLLFQGQLNPPVTDLQREAFFTTACNYYGAKMNALQGPADTVSIQRLPRLATIQPFELLAHAKGLLFNRFAPGADVVSILQKEEGEDVLKVVDEYREPAAETFETPARQILFMPTEQPWTLTAQKNLWWQVLQQVHEAERTHAGIAKSPVLPRIWMPQIGRDHHLLLGRRGKRSEALQLLADEMVPRWAASGVREICCPSYWVSDYTVDRFRTKNESGLQGGFSVSGICCVRVHEIDPLFGGPEALACLVDTAHRHDIKVQLWWATHLSRRAPIFAEHPEWMIRSRNGHPGCGGIGDDVIIPMDLSNPDCFEWELDKLKTLHEQTGIDGFFHDSYGNYTFMPVNYADPQRRSQTRAYARLVNALQQAGMTTFTGEGIGPWAVGHFAMNLLPTEAGTQGSFQNALDWWLGHEDMVSGLSMGIHTPLWADRQQARAFAFRCLAAGGRFGFTQYEGQLELWSGWLRELNLIHAQLGSLEGERWLLPDDQGIRWRLPDGREILFAFRSQEVPLAGKRASRLTATGLEPMPGRDSLITEPFSVYCFDA